MKIVSYFDRIYTSFAFSVFSHIHVLYILLFDFVNAESCFVIFDMFAHCTGNTAQCFLFLN